MLAKAPFENLNSKKEQLKDYTNSLIIDEAHKIILQDKPIHLFLEISVFADKPYIHGKFIERYNLLMHMKRALSSCFFFTLVGFGIILPQTLIIIIMELVFLLFSSILFRSYIRIESGFLDRVLTSHVVATRQTKD